MMGTYLMMLYVSLEQEVAVKQLFTTKGWGYNKPDLRMMTGDIGPLMEETMQTKVVTNAPSQDILQTQPVLQSQEFVLTQTSEQVSRQVNQIMEQSNYCHEMPLAQALSDIPKQQDQQSAEEAKRPKRTPKRNPKYFEKTEVDTKSAKKTSKPRTVKSHPKVEVDTDKSNKSMQENAEFQEILQEAEIIAASLSNIETENYEDHKTPVSENETDSVETGQFQVKIEQYADDDDITDFDTQVNDNTVENTETDNVPSCSNETEEVSAGPSGSRTSSAKKRKMTGKIVASQGETKKSREKRRQYDVAQMSKAYHAITEKKMSIYQASREYGVPESTLRDRIKERIPFYEDRLPTIQARLFNDDEELTLAEHFNHMSYLGYGYIAKDMKVIACDYAISLKKADPVKSSHTQSNCWYYNFKKRFPYINPRKFSANISVERANATSAGTVHIYYTNLKAILDSVDNKPDQIYIIDEITLPMKQSAEDVKYVETNTNESVSGDDAKSLTLIGCANATGSLVPPYFVLPGNKWNDSYLEGTCPGSDGECSQDGDTNALVFSNYFNKHFRKFVPFGKDSKPIVVLYDGQKSNLMLTLKTLGEENNITFFVLPPHASCITGLKLGCFHPITEVFNKESCLYLRKKNELSLENSEVGRLASKAYLKTMTPAALSAAFKRMGVYPFDSGVVRKSDFDDRSLDFTGFLNQSEVVENSENDMLDE